MLCAAIDIGSNTTRVLVAEPEDGQLRTVMEQRAYTRIGRTPSTTGRSRRRRWPRLPRSSRPRCGSPRSWVRRRSAPSPPPRSARRPTRDEVAAEIGRVAGVEVDVLSEEEEGKLAFIGATKTLGHPVEGEVAVVDVGGGSSEIVFGTVAGGVVRGSGRSRSALARSPRTTSRTTRPRPRRSASLRDAISDFFEESRSTSPTRRSPWAAAPPRCESWSAPCSSTRRSSAACASSAATRSPRSPGASSSTRGGCRCSPPACSCLEKLSELLGQPLQIGKGGLREGVILTLLNGAANGAPQALAA